MGHTSAEDTIWIQKGQLYWGCMLDKTNHRVWRQYTEQSLPSTLGLGNTFDELNNNQLFNSMNKMVVAQTLLDVAKTLYTET